MVYPIMFETQPEGNRPSTGEVILGFLLGILASLLCLFFCVFLGSTLGGRPWTFPVINGLALVGVGIMALRKVRESSYALGVVIAVSLMFLLNAACGRAFYR
jgi:uncharacterized membrane protein YccC